MRLDIPASASVFDKPAKVPLPKEVDSIAAFVEAAEELIREPFFGPDEKRTWSHSGNNDFTFHLGDRFHFRSALINFRRIWMQGEASNFDTVHGILWRYARALPERFHLLWARAFVRQAEEQDTHQPLITKLRGRDLVDLWLNTVFAHGGMDEKRRHTRAGFDRIAAECGRAPFEYAFRTAVWSIGTQYIAVSRTLARSALGRWKDEFNLQPSFTIGTAFGTSTRERTKEGHVIVRRASSEYAADETFDQRLRRILDRRQFEAMKCLLTHFDFADKNLVRMVLKSADFTAIANTLDYEIKIVEQLSEHFDDYGKGFRASTNISLQNGRQWTQVYIYESFIVTTGVGLEALTSQFADLKWCWWRIEHTNALATNRAVRKSHAATSTDL